MNRRDMLKVVPPVALTLLTSRKSAASKVAAQTFELPDLEGMTPAQRFEAIDKFQEATREATQDAIKKVFRDATNAHKVASSWRKWNKWDGVWVFYAREASDGKIVASERLSGAININVDVILNRSGGPLAPKWSTDRPEYEGAVWSGEVPSREEADRLLRAAGWILL